MRVGPARRIDVQDSALAVLVNIAHGFAHAFIPVEGQPQHRKGELFVTRARKRAPRLEHVDLRVAVSAGKAGHERLFEVGSGGLEEMNQVAVVPDAGLVEAVVDVVAEIHRLAVGRIFVARQVEVGDARNVLHLDRRQGDGHGARLERGKRVVADVEVPQGFQDALATNGGGRPKQARQRLGEVVHGSFVAVNNPLGIRLDRSGPHPCAQIPSVFVEHVIDTFLKPAADHGVGFGVQSRRQGLQNPRALLAPVNLPVIPLPKALGGLEAHGGNGVVEISFEGSEEITIVSQIFEVLIEQAGCTPARACVGRAKRRRELSPAACTGFTPADQHLPQRPRCARLDHLARVAERMNERGKCSWIGHMPERPCRGFTRERLIAGSENAAGLSPHRLGREVPELVELPEETRQLVSRKTRRGWRERVIPAPLGGGFGVRSGVKLRKSHHGKFRGAEGRVEALIDRVALPASFRALMAQAILDRAR